MGILEGGKWERLYDESRRFYSPEGISPTLSTNGGGHHEVKIGELHPVEGNVDKCRERESYDARCGISDQLEDGGGDNLCVETVVRVRRLTPRECYRLMGFDDEDYDKARAVVSEGQLYKQAGNSIVVNVLEAIFTNLRPYFRKEAV
jgi:DNA (cytosine-5)-methyltransferase 1